MPQLASPSRDIPLVAGEPPFVANPPPVVCTRLAGALGDETVSS
jgi:hypothetical protein